MVFLNSLYQQNLLASIHTSHASATCYTVHLDTLKRQQLYLNIRISLYEFELVVQNVVRGCLIPLIGLFILFWGRRGMRNFLIRRKFCALQHDIGLAVICRHMYCEGKKTEGCDLVRNVFNIARIYLIILKIFWLIYKTAIYTLKFLLTLHFVNIFL